MTAPGVASTAGASWAVRLLFAAALAQGGSAVLVRAQGSSRTTTPAAQPVTPISALSQPGPPDARRGGRGQLAGPLAAAELTPPQFLVISSPRERKVVYTELRDFRSTSGRTFTLVDTGLEEPCELAYDRQGGKLYVADRGQRAVFRYSLFVEPSGGGHRLQTDGTRLTILLNRTVGGLTVDTYGALFFTDEASRSVNKITPQLMYMLSASDVAAEDLGVVSEGQLESASSRQIESSMNAGPGRTTDAPGPAPLVQALYEAGETPEAAAPTGVASDGVRLYWANGGDGLRSGTVVEGRALPQAGLLAGRGRFPVSVLANGTEAAHGLVQTDGMLLFTGEARGSGAVFGLSKSGGPAFRYLSGLSQPRGLAWDGDNTAYVADAGGSRVYSFPVSRRVEGAPAVPAVDFSGAHGLALVSRGDGAWRGMAGLPSAARRGARPRGALALALLLGAGAARR